MLRCYDSGSGYSHGYGWFLAYPIEVRSSRSATQPKITNISITPTAWQDGVEDEDEQGWERSARYSSPAPNSYKNLSDHNPDPAEHVISIHIRILTNADKIMKGACSDETP